MSAFLQRSGSLLKTISTTSASAKSSLVARTMSTASTFDPSKYKFETLVVSAPAEHVIQVELNRPKKLNSMNRAFWREMRDCFASLSTEPDCRAIFITGAGKLFTAGLDLQDAVSMFNMDVSDPSRRAVILRNIIRDYQDSFTNIEKCSKPVIAAIHNGCIGGGVDLVTACDIRLCSADAYFQIKEVDIGLAADVGTLQRLPKIIGSDSVVRELTYTARKMNAEEAKQRGLVSHVYATEQELREKALEMAKLIASKSPIAVLGSKHNLNYSRDHSVSESLDYMVSWNMSMLQSEDIMVAVGAAMEKSTPVFSKL